MRSVFVAGTDTDAGKTVAAAGIARAYHDAGCNVGVMKPYAASDGPSRSGNFRSDDAAVLAEAARSADADSQINPEFYETAASPLAVMTDQGRQADPQAVVSAYKRLAAGRDAMVVEGMGGAMTPITARYFMADLASDMGLGAVICTSNRIGALALSVSAHMACVQRGLDIVGFVISCADRGGYDPAPLGRDISAVTGAQVIGSIPFLGVPDAGAAAAAVKGWPLRHLLGV